MAERFIVDGCFTMDTRYMSAAFGEGFFKISYTRTTTSSGKSTYGTAILKPNQKATRLFAAQELRSGRLATVLV